MLFLSVVALRSCINLRCILHSAAPPTYIRPLSMRIHPAGRAAQATLKTQNFSHQDRRLSQLFMTWRSSIFLFLMGSQETSSIFIANANIVFYTLHLQSHTLQSLLYIIPWYHCISQSWKSPPFIWDATASPPARTPHIISSCSLISNQMDTAGH